MKACYICVSPYVSLEQGIDSAPTKGIVMRVPTDRSLTSYIRELEKNKQIWKFYKTEDWIELKNEVLRDSHYECAMCKAEGKVEPAVVVHHVNHVRKNPELALSRTYIDEEGNERPQLVPLCEACHNKVHPEKLKGHKKDKEKFTNIERW